MKFGDKLIQLRKKNGLSQEELAEKLGVSRQSVSKWESNNTYPETDKIVQICNIFDCSMDDLINDKVDLDQTYRKNKNALNEGMDSFLEFITKTVKMFSNMSFADGFKCILKLVLYTLVLLLVGQLITKSLATIIANIFSFLTPHTISNIREGLKAVLYGVWFIGTFVVMIHTFKIQYLDKYHQEEIKNENTEEKQNKKETKNSNEKEESVEVKHQEKSYSFIKGLSKFFILCIKFIVILFLIGVAASTVSLTIGTVISLSLITINKIFIGSSLALIGGTTIAIIILSIGIHFIFDKKIHFLTHIIIFLSAILLCGIGIGVSALCIKNFSIIPETTIELKEETITVDYIENMVIQNVSGRSDQYRYIINNEIEDGKIEITKMIDSETETISTYVTYNDQMPVYHVHGDFNGKVSSIFHRFVEDLKKNEIHANYGSYDSNEPIIIKANENTINRLIENTKKLYLISVEENENERIVTIHDDKVYFPYGVMGYYDAREDQLYLDDEGDYKCIRSVSDTEWGEKIIFSCKYEEDFD